MCSIDIKKEKYRALGKVRVGDRCRKEAYKVREFVQMTQEW